MHKRRTPRFPRGGSSTVWVFHLHTCNKCMHKQTNKQNHNHVVAMVVFVVVVVVVVGGGGALTPL
jgi:hypothetical protein